MCCIKQGHLEKIPNSTFEYYTVVQLRGRDKRRQSTTAKGTKKLNNNTDNSTLSRICHRSEKLTKFKNNLSQQNVLSTRFLFGGYGHH